MKQDISLLELLKSGAHFGHTTSRWNPRMKQYIYSVRGNIHILDLAETKKGLQTAADMVENLVAKGGSIMFVGTKRQCRAVIQAAADSCGMPYMTTRWLGGTFTNFRTIQKTIKKLASLHQKQDSGELTARHTKKERLLLEREMLKLERLFAGVKNMHKLPEAIFVADINHDATAVREARKTGVQIVGLVDSNSNPQLVDLAIPCNDDAVGAVTLVANCIAEAARQGRLRAGTMLGERPDSAAIQETTAEPLTIPNLTDVPAVAEVVEIVKI